ncbi:MAG: hypothetical protein LUC90_05555 [Lachnospiraceae bacterium]|nr:hypothetical protein [Lachnospiraceae bacterium]
MSKKKKKEKMLTDKGFQLFYGNLSTRRQLIRNIWVEVIGIVIFALAWMQGVMNQNILLLLLVIFTCSQAYQIGRNWLTWKEEKEKLEKQRRAQEKQEKVNHQKEQKDNL